MSTPQDLINKALVLSGDIGSGDSVSASDNELALFLLNNILEDFSLDKLLAYSITRVELALNANQQSYTIGAGGNFNIAVPININRASLLYNNHETPLETFNINTWQLLSNKFTSGLPKALYTDNNFPLSTIYLYPVSTDGLAKLVLYLQTPLQTINADNLTQEIYLPPGYQQAITYSLAYEMSLTTDSPKPYLEAKAEKAKASIRENSNNTDVELIPNNEDYLFGTNSFYNWWNS